MKTNLNKECTVRSVTPERNIVTLDDESLISLEVFKELANEPIIDKKYYLRIDLTNKITAITLLP